MDKELDSLYETSTKTNERLIEGRLEKVSTEVRLHGIEALDSFVRKLNPDDFAKYSFKFTSLYQAKQLLLIVNTFDLIDKRLEISFLSPDVKRLFEAKMSSFYSCRSRSALRRISELTIKQPTIADHVSASLVDFFNRKEKQYNEPATDE
jgi:hypothetical protein